MNHLLACACAAAAGTLLASNALASFQVEGSIWGGGFPGGGQDSVWTSIGSQGGTGGGTTGAGFGRITVEVQPGTASLIRLTGSASHVSEFGGHSSAYTRNQDTGQLQGLLLTLDAAVNYSIVSSAQAFTADGSFAITPVRLIAESGTMTSLDGVTGTLSAGTYRIEAVISAFGNYFDQGFLPLWSGYGSLQGAVVTSATMDWSLTMTAVPSPGAAVLAFGAFLAGRSRRRRGDIRA